MGKTAHTKKPTLGAPNREASDINGVWEKNYRTESGIKKSVIYWRVGKPYTSQKKGFPRHVANTRQGAVPAAESLAAAFHR